MRKKVKDQGIPHSLWSVRMRASRDGTCKSQKSKVRSPQLDEIHISGAEGLYEFSEIPEITKEYSLRAMNHPRGRPDKIIITMERIMQKIKRVPLLPHRTVQCGSPDGAREVIRELLLSAGISQKAIRCGMRIVTGKAAMHGAALVQSGSAVRMEPDRQRGVRVSRLGILREEERRLSRRLARQGINTTIVKEALILASKVASCGDVLAELCISDDPDYTIGYVASRRFGYIRIPCIKHKGSPRGGRVFFIKEGADVAWIIEYLERIPVIVET
ncbi:MAG TPA: 6-carboxyhexanoate--CoA ligase [Thermodesulfovibrionales bacterium]|nr:6-carboxyhexanoate--CoA ligase [Thermodesulfovibrionales bacterium]